MIASILAFPAYPSYFDLNCTRLPEAARCFSQLVCAILPPISCKLSSALIQILSEYHPRENTSINYIYYYLSWKWTLFRAMSVLNILLFSSHSRKIYTIIENLKKVIYSASFLIRDIFHISDEKKFLFFSESVFKCCSIRPPQNVLLSMKDMRRDVTIQSARTSFVECVAQCPLSWVSMSHTRHSPPRFVNTHCTFCAFCLSRAVLISREPLSSDAPLYAIGAAPP